MSELEGSPTKRRYVDGAEVLTYEKVGEEDNVSQDVSGLIEIKRKDPQFTNNLKNLSSNAIEKCLNSVLFTIDEDKLIREDISSYYRYISCIYSLKSSSPRDISKEDKKMIFNSTLDALEELCLYNRDISFFYKQEYAATIIDLCKISESRILQLSSPVYCFGDIHGNLTDFRKIAKYIWPLGFTISAGKYLFLGDYVDRGEFGIEIIAYLFSQKLQNPNKVFLLRGNHETRGVNGWSEIYGDKCLYKQCINRYGNEIGNILFDSINDVFDSLPLCCIIDNNVFSVHGGIPEPLLIEKQDKKEKEMVKEMEIDNNNNNNNDRLNIINNLPNNLPIYCENENISLENKRIIEQLLWSDPCDSDSVSYDSNGFCDSIRSKSNKCRSYGVNAVNSFLNEYNLSYIVRGHQAIKSGISFNCNNKVITVFSTTKDHGFVDSCCIGIVLIQDDDIISIRLKENLLIKDENNKSIVGISDYFVDDEVKGKEKSVIDKERENLLCKENLKLRN